MKEKPFICFVNAPFFEENILTRGVICSSKKIKGWNRGLISFGKGSERRTASCFNIVNLDTGEFVVHGSKMLMPAWCNDPLLCQIKAIEYRKKHNML